MLKLLKRVDKGVEWIQTWSTGILLFVIMWLVFAMVFFRYVLNNSIVWAEEILRYTDMWLILIGVGLTARADQNICIDVVQSCLEKFPKIRAAHYIFTRCVVAVFMLYMIVPATELIVKSSASTATSVPWLYMSAVYCAFPVGAVLLTLSLCSQVPQKVVEILNEGHQKGKK